MTELTVLKKTKCRLGDVTYAEYAWVPGQAIVSEVRIQDVPITNGRLVGSPSGDVEIFNWGVRALWVGEPPAENKIAPWQLNDLREAAGLPRGPEIPRAGWAAEPF